MASVSAPIGATARPTTIKVMSRRVVAIAEPIRICVTMPSQISFISSFGCEVITSDPDTPLTVTGTLTDVRSGRTKATNQAGGPFGPSLMVDGADAALPEISRVMLTWRNR